MLVSGELPVSGWNGLLFAVPFLIGVASAGQSIHAKLGGDWLRVLRTVSGWLYWLSRGAIPAACYLWCLVNKLGSHHDVATAVLCGLGSEAVLRSRLFIGSATVSGKPENIYKGVFDLVEWYQDLLLRSASNSLAAGLQDFVSSALGSTTDFPGLCAKAKSNAGSFRMSGDELCARVDEVLAAFRKEEGKGTGCAPEMHSYYACRLGYALLRVIDRQSFETLFRA